jgi:hypothetical protein
LLGLRLEGGRQALALIPIKTSKTSNSIARSGTSAIVIRVLVPGSLEDRNGARAGPNTILLIAFLYS